MTSYDDIPPEHPIFEELERLRRHTKIAWDHTVAFKSQFHDMQDKMLEAMDRSAAHSRTIRRQREIIADLEQRLGLDDEL